MTYDRTNIFARILRKEVAAEILLETPHTLVFHDAYPKAPVHILVIPKGEYCDAQHFHKNASPEEVYDFSQAISQAVDRLSLYQNGFRLVSNCRAHGGQEVPHYHMHILGGKILRKMDI